ncbi:hypothetical protein R51_31610 [Bacillus safensis]|nr:hypothetical protein R51_31610 [Bacillus safensis]
MQKYMPKSAEEIAYILKQAEILQRSYEFSASITSFLAFPWCPDLYNT